MGNVHRKMNAHTDDNHSASTQVANCAPRGAKPWSKCGNCKKWNCVCASESQESAELPNKPINPNKTQVIDSDDETGLPPASQHVSKRPKRNASATRANPFVALHTIGVCREGTPCYPGHEWITRPDGYKECYHCTQKAP